MLELATNYQPFRRSLKTSHVGSGKALTAFLVGAAASKRDRWRHWIEVNQRISGAVVDPNLEMKVRSCGAT